MVEGVVEDEDVLVGFLSIRWDVAVVLSPGWCQKGMNRGGGEGGRGGALLTSLYRIALYYHYCCYFLPLLSCQLLPQQHRRGCHNEHPENDRLQTTKRLLLPLKSRRRDTTGRVSRCARIIVRASATIRRVIVDSRCLIGNVL